MKRRTKIIVFIASMALTVGSLVAFVGPGHCRHHGMYRHCDKMNDHNYHRSNCTNRNDRSEIDSAKAK